MKNQMFILPSQPKQKTDGQRHARASLAVVLAGALMMSATAHAASFVLAYTDGQLGQSYTNLQAYYKNLSAVGLGSAYGLNKAGVIDVSGVTSTTTNIIRFAKSVALPLYPTVSDYSNSTGGFDPAISKAILTSPSVSTSTVANMVALAKNNGFAGIDLDFEAVRAADKAAYSAFVSALATSLHANGMKLIISVPPKTSDSAPDYLAGYDYAALGAAVDYFQLMTYDQVGPGWSSSGFNGEIWPGPESGANWQKALFSYAVTRIPANKVLAGLPSYGYDYSTGQTVYWSAYAGVIAAHGATTHLDAASATPYATWGAVKNIADGTAWSAATAQPVLWYDDVTSIQAKTALVQTYNLGGTSVWAMGYEDANFWSAVKAGLGNGLPAALVLHASAGAGGAISPSGDINVVQGANQAVAITPNTGYTISAVAVDGVKVASVTAYTFYDVQSSHTISATFAAAPVTPTPNLATLGTGYLWTKNANGFTDTNKVASKLINDGNLGAAITLNPAGEGGAAKWEAAGVLWSSAKSISAVKFVNGAIDSNGNGYLSSGVSLQFSTNGTTWFDSGWTISPRYPYSAAAAGASFEFAGAMASGIVGVRVTGKTGSDSWSWRVNEIQVTGH